MSTPQTKPEHERSTGARPAGITTEQAAAANVQQMFDTIAPTYDRANHLLSAGIDRWWWSRTARLFRPILQHPETVALDLCCGTGDMTLALLKHRPKSPGAPSFAVSPRSVGDENCDPAKTRIAPILAVDFSHQMLSLGAKKFAPRMVAGFVWCEERAALLQFREGMDYRSRYAELLTCCSTSSTLARVVEIKLPGIGWPKPPPFSATQSSAHFPLRLRKTLATRPIAESSGVPSPQSQTAV